MKAREDKISFRRHPKEKGLFAIGHPYQGADIKLNGKKIGIINAPSWNSKDDKYEIQFAINKDENNNNENSNCQWMWLLVKERFDKEDDARKWFIDHFERIKEKYQIYSFED